MSATSKRIGSRLVKRVSTTSICTLTTVTSTAFACNSESKFASFAARSYRREVIEGGQRGWLARRCRDDRVASGIGLACSSTPVQVLVRYRDLRDIPVLNLVRECRIRQGDRGRPLARTASAFQAKSPAKAIHRIQLGRKRNLHARWGRRRRGTRHCCLRGSPRSPGDVLLVIPANVPGADLSPGAKVARRRRPGRPAEPAASYPARRASGRRAQEVFVEMPCSARVADLAGHRRVHHCRFGDHHCRVVWWASP